ncbi:Germin-like protein subfamily 3 member 2 [Capsicum annuum]|uniref:Germin-like protein subfamily 3 member 2 n=1 Tax=Capsicum annuum TaxID=4072 RepID=A0A2G2Z0N7_CAPAN|nr:Germin-like protein subfamily 3 member 2 [Capsicum annuum]PHT75461.1 Germin-like protein subfamily 3 member 2 [Capsicum annuum]
MVSHRIHEELEFRTIRGHCDFSTFETIIQAWIPSPRSFRMRFTRLDSPFALFFFILAYDPDPVHDYCIPREEFTSIFLSCKHSSLVTVDDFVYSGTKDPGNFKHSGFSSIPISSTVFPRLNTLGMSFVHADFDVDGVNVPHFHPRATETALVLKGKIYSGFVDSGNRVFAKVNSITKYSLTSSENFASMSFPSSAV